MWFMVEEINFVEMIKVFVIQNYVVLVLGQIMFCQVLMEIGGEMLVFIILEMVGFIGGWIGDFCVMQEECQVEVIVVYIVIVEWDCGFGLQIGVMVIFDIVGCVECGGQWWVDVVIGDDGYWLCVMNVFDFFMC